MPLRLTADGEAGDADGRGWERSDVRYGLSGTVSWRRNMSRARRMLVLMLGVQTHGVLEAR